jgi:hypothetical protein
MKEEKGKEKLFDSSAYAAGREKGRQVGIKVGRHKGRQARRKVGRQERREAGRKKRGEKAGKIKKFKISFFLSIYALVHVFIL